MAATVSVFVTSYNQKAYLIEAIDSVLGQTVKPFEILVVDDASTDGSRELIEGYARSYPGLIRSFFHPQNLGIPRNKSFALSQARGELVTYLDGDDRFLPRKIELELETLRQHPDARIVYSNSHRIDAHGTRTGQWAAPAAVLPTGDAFPEVFGRWFPMRSLFRNEIVERACFAVAGLYDPDFAMYHDWELRIRLTSRYRAAYCPEALSEYRIHSGEYIVIDGGSTDDSVSIIKAHEAELAYWISEPDSGQYEALNKGFARASGDILAWLNSDDMHVPWALRLVGGVFATLEDVEWLSSLSPIFWNEEGLACRCVHLGGFDRRAFLWGERSVAQESTFWRRSLWARAGGALDASWQLAADFELWARFWRHATLYGLTAPLGGMRLHRDQRHARYRAQCLAEAAEIRRRYGGRRESVAIRGARKVAREFRDAMARWPRARELCERVGYYRARNVVWRDGGWRIADAYFR